MEGEHRGGAVQRQHDHSRRSQLGRKVVAEGQRRQLDEGIAAERKAAVHLVAWLVVRRWIAPQHQPQAVFKREILGQR